MYSSVCLIWSFLETLFSLNFSYNSYLVFLLFYVLQNFLNCLVTATVLSSGEFNHLSVLSCTSNLVYASSLIISTKLENVGVTLYSSLSLTANKTFPMATMLVQTLLISELTFYLVSQPPFFPTSPSLHPIFSSHCRLCDFLKMQVWFFDTFALNLSMLSFFLWWHWLHVLFGGLVP